MMHQLLPLPLEKKARREERHAVAALYAEDEVARRWLLAKRPATGLLAGQWEFPHAVVASDAATLPDDPGAPERSRALDTMLRDAAASSPARPSAKEEMSSGGVSWLGGSPMLPGRYSGDPTRTLSSVLSHTFAFLPSRRFSSTRFC